MYDINLDNVKKKRGFFCFFLLFGLVLFLVCWLVVSEVWGENLGFDGEYDKPQNYFCLVFFVMPIIAVLVGIVGLVKVNIKIKMIKKLNKVGKLVKGLPYTMEPSGLSVNNSPILRPVVEYHLDGGDIVKLYGDARFDRLWKDRDGLVDLVIDENNPDNYFIDFEINRLGGNLPTDYSDNMGGIYNNYAGFLEQNEYETMKQITDMYNSDRGDKRSY